MQFIPPFILIFLVFIYPTAPLAAGEIPSGGGVQIAQGGLEEEIRTGLDQETFQEEEQELIVYDPIESYNRKIFWFNDKFYFYLLKPAAKAYRVVPEPARVSVSNFFSNLSTPIRLINALLQLKIKDTGTEFARFAMNTTIGIGGLFDPAKKYAGLEKKDEDFGQTLGRYGAEPGFYIIWPVIGSSNFRDTIGRVADAFLDPIYYFDITVPGQLGAKVFDNINYISLDKDTYEGIKKEALDPYLFIRDAYTQKREGKIKK